MIINFIQDIATPHNNTILRELEEDPNVKLNVWYSHEKHEQYAWDKDLTNEIKTAHIFSPKKIDWAFVKYALSHKSEKFFIVGWETPTIRVLILLFALLRRPYNMWFDLPRDNIGRGVVRSFFRKIYYFLLKHSKSKVFCVGKQTVQYFQDQKFDSQRLCNLPIFVSTDKDKLFYLPQKEAIHSKYKIRNGDYFLTTGSRLVREKGFDLLIEAIGKLPEEYKTRTRLLIVGKGEQKTQLNQEITDLDLSDQIIIEDWLDIEDFLAAVAISDIFIHPSRFDAFGGTIFAMAVGTPVIGSRQAGAAYDRIDEGVNGYLYDAKDTAKLASLICKCIDDGNLNNLGENARKTAEKWSPKVGLRILIKEVI